MTAAMGVILDPKARKQKIFGAGEVEEQKAKNKAVANCHTDDVTALAVNEDRTLVASG